MPAYVYARAWAGRPAGFHSREGDLRNNKTSDQFSQQQTAVPQQLASLFGVQGCAFASSHAATSTPVPSVTAPSAAGFTQPTPLLQQAIQHTSHIVSDALAALMQNFSSWDDLSAEYAYPTRRLLCLCHDISLILSFSLKPEKVNFYHF